jgi:hypothetical protein
MKDRTAIPAMSADLVVGLTLAAFGCAELWSASSLPILTDFTVGPGALPIAYSSGLILFSILIVGGAASRKDERRTQRLPTPINIYRGVILMALTLIFVAAIYVIGFLASCILFSIALSYFICEVDMTRSILFGTIWSVAIYCLFKYALQVPLEAGILFS